MFNSCDSAYNDVSMRIAKSHNANCDSSDGLYTPVHSDHDHSPDLGEQTVVPHFVILDCWIGRA